jgi:hypothetical protein
MCKQYQIFDDPMFLSQLPHSFIKSEKSQGANLEKHFTASIYKQAAIS